MRVTHGEAIVTGYSKLIAACDRIAETGLVYLVDRNGEVREVACDVYQAMTMAQLAGALVFALPADAQRASLRVRGIETGPEVQRN